jgi:hypothetical protein
VQKLLSKWCGPGLCAFAAFAVLAAQSLAQQIPRTELTTLTNSSVTIPVEPGVKPLLVVVGFSHKSSKDAADWNKLYKVTYETDPRLDYYEIGDFQGVPSFVMKMILHGMKRSFQEPERSHFAPFYTHEQDWKNLVRFTDPSICYVVLSDKTGHVAWQIRGPATAAKAAELEAAVANLVNHSK